MNNNKVVIVTQELEKDELMGIFNYQKEYGLNPEFIEGKKEGTYYIIRPALQGDPKQIITKRSRL